MRSVHNELPVIVVRHVRERTRGSNTGRLVLLTLENAELVEIGAPDAPPVDPTRFEGMGVLWPDGPASVEDVSGLVVVDATWRQAYKMRLRVPGLAALPRVGLVGGERPRMRRQNAPGRMATAEAVAMALGCEELERVFAMHVERMARSRGKGGRGATER